MTNLYYNVSPRYTGGSPAQVTLRIADQVAREEQTAHARALTGIYGDEERERAAQGLRGISEEVSERADAWIVRDLITGERFVRPFTIYGETALRQSRRFWRLRQKYELPLETELK